MIRYYYANLICHLYRLTPKCASNTWLSKYASQDDPTYENNRWEECKLQRRIHFFNLINLK